MANSDGMAKQQRATAAAGAILLAIGFATGGLLAGVQTGTFHADEHSVVAAHLNGVLGCFWLCALAFTLPMLRLGARGTRVVVACTWVAAYSNWLFTVIKSFLEVKGVGITDDGANNAIFALLNVFVVVPSLVGAIGWAYGLVRKQS